MKINPATIFQLFLLSNLAACQYSQQSSFNLPEKISYNYHIKPIISDRCFSCHGPDQQARKAGLRLDQGEELFDHLTPEGRHLLVKGRVSRSELWQRIVTEDPEKLMPPPESKLALSDYEKELIRKWIEEGAVVEKHWAFQPIKRIIPPVGDEGHLENIDLFIKQKLRKNNLDFSDEADKNTLLRRLYFDLTGIGPTPMQITAFNSNTSDHAYEALVDSLLKTDAYAERMAVDWLDVSRYADSQGMHSDGWRSMYPWRDWVIRAFKSNMYFDQFIVEQLAGDLLNEPTTDQLVATGFNRNHETTAEGGVVDEEFRKEYAHDRVKTTGTAFLGMTMECARCHDHKYDPITQKEYYGFFGFFDQVDEVGLTGDDGNSGPNLLLPDAITQAHIDSLNSLISFYEEELYRDQEVWSKNQESFSLPDFDLWQGREIYLPFNKIYNRSIDGIKNANTTPGVEIVNTERGNAIEINSEYEFLTLREVGLFEQNIPFSAALWVKPFHEKTSQTLLGNSGQKGVFWRGWDFILDSLNRPMLRLINALPHDALIVRSEMQIDTNQWSHLSFTYDGSGKAKGCKIFINGEPVRLVVIRDALQRSIYPMAFNKERTNTPLRVGKSYRAFTGEYGIFAGLMDDIMVFRRRLSRLEIMFLTGKEFRKSSITNRDSLKSLVLDHQFATNDNSNKIKLTELRERKIRQFEEAAEVMIMTDQKEAVATHILMRGDYNQKGEIVEAGTPQAILPFPDSLPKNRLGLAKWIISNENPLTARVIINRLWQQFFGRGIVESSHDFGVQGRLPTHPELLDFLAYQFREDGWDLQKVIKQIVLSRTYRQTSQISEMKRNSDPENTWYSRGPKLRLTAEMIRDQALAAGSLLDHTIGGPSVKPWQPEGLWKEKTSSTHLLRSYEPDTGADRYRRSLYTFVRRTSMHPMMEIFDAPTRSVCTVKRQSTETPQQALVLLNDPQFIEASRVLAEKMLKEFATPKDRIERAYLRLCSKNIDQQKLESILAFYQEERNRFLRFPEDAISYVTIGQYPPIIDNTVVELAATTLVVNTIMNLDDFYLKR